MSPAPQPLPIDPLLPQLIEALRSGPAVVLEAAPGAGKTTRVPAALQAAELAGGLEIIVAEPRRLAARMAAQRVAAERSEPLGGLVGYRVRFEEVVSDATRIVYVTEGILLRRFLKDPTLAGVAVVILDEFHERHLETDLLLALLWRLIRGARPDLKLVVMSATLDAAHVAQYLGNCPRVHSSGRVFPIELEHLPQVDARPLEKQVVSAVRRLLAEQDQGDVLVFLPGAAEIRRASSAMEALAQEQSLRVLPLHGDLPMAEQVRAIERAPQRKVVLSTNVAESSVTIDGVSAVVDSGLARVAAHSPWSGLPTLTTAKISRASATQRAGRAGRTQTGRVLRLYTRGDFLTRPEHDEPEITRSDLTEALLLLHGIGGGQAPAVSFITEPAAAALNAARAALEAIGALTADGSLNATGRRLLELPVHPRLARVIVEGERRGVARKAALLAALLGERDVRSAGRTDFGPMRSQVDTVSGPSDVLALADAFEVA
ncbi:MAG TPA: helicase-related protein, partial [Polyangiaceae bacterium]|nr:helicase-related protein [Polyangiaceae bacterium]